MTAEENFEARVRIEIQKSFQEADIFRKKTITHGLFHVLKEQPLGKPRLENGRPVLPQSVNFSQSSIAV